jgi:hypothetical protein
MTPTSPQRIRRRFLLILLVCALVSLACVVYPIYVIRPFRAQGPTELAAALVVSRFRAVVTMLSALAAFAGLVAYWRAQPRKLLRFFTTLAVAFVCLLAYLARVNVYELMFHPVGRPSFIAAQQAKIDPDDKVIAISISGEAHAYPIRTMGYHHIVNDVVGSRAIVATY